MGPIHPAGPPVSNRIRRPRRVSLPFRGGGRVTADRAPPWGRRAHTSVRAGSVWGVPSWREDESDVDATHDAIRRVTDVRGPWAGGARWSVTWVGGVGARERGETCELECNATKSPPGGTGFKAAGLGCWCLGGESKWAPTKGRWILAYKWQVGSVIELNSKSLTR